MLEELHITRQSIRHPPRKLEWLDIVSLISSRIYSATFFGVIFRPSDFSSTPEHVWEHLTELNLELSPSPMDSDEIDMADFASAVIRHCRLLKSLKLRVSTILSANDSSPQWRHDTKNILLEHLTVLSLSLPLTREVVGFVKCLCLPSIRNLDFHVTSNYHNQTFEMANNVLRALLHICGDNLQSLGLYSPSYLTSSKNMVQLLQLTPHLKSLYVCSSSLPHNRWVSPSCDISAVKDIINDELLHALSPLGNDYSDIICPQLEALECDYRSIRTGITENGLKEFAKARKLSHLNDQRVASLRRLCVPIDDLKQQVEPNTEKVSLGSDSCIYFQKPQEYSLSPWEGLIEWREPTSGSHIPQEIYNEL
ncbi:hypothetical protein BDQ17DRAFT_989751 [Cyathus striatus]|nr:hypothetical protein BDQ17DRAFT_989751 [Cyathus striatus]